MSRKRDMTPPRAGRAGRNPRVRPSLTYRLWRLVVEHPRGVLIAAATLLGLIVVLGNWRPTRAKLLVWEPELPFIVWAMIFMLVGYLTGKWIEWAIQQRRIRKGTYRPRLSAEDLASKADALDGKLPAAADASDPATLIDRSAKPKDVPPDAAVERMDYWTDGDAPSDVRAVDQASRLGARAVPDRPRDRPGGYAPANERASGPAPSRHRGAPGAEGGRYADYADYQDGGRYADYNDYVEGRRPGARYSDYADYADYQDGAPRRGGHRR